MSHRIIPVSHDSNMTWDWPLRHTDDFIQVCDDDNHFEVGLDASYFTPNDIEVKAVGEMLQIHLEHEPREDERGTTTRKIDRSYKLPDRVDTKTLKSNLDNQGVLHISAKKTR